MKKIYLCTVALAMIAGNSAFAQLGFMDPIKPSADLTFDSEPLSRIMLKSGTMIEEEKVNGTWRNLTKTIGLQDAQANQLEFSSSDWDTVANAWSVGFGIKQTLAYDAQNKLTSRRSETSSQGSTVLISNYTYAYDANGKFLPVTGLDSINQGGAWMSFNSKDSIVYNGSGNIIERIKSRSFMGISAPFEKTTFAYNAGGKLTAAVVYEYDNDVWVENERYTYTYNANNDILTYFSESFNDPNWEGNELDSFYYTGNLLTSKVDYYYNNNVAEPESYNEYTYTGTDITELIEKNWMNGAWVNSDKTIITYAGGKLSTGLIYKWTNNAWEADHYKRISTTTVGLRNVNTETLGLYPNPTSQNITLSGNVALNTVVSIYNIAGVLVKTETLTNNTINVENLNNGIYFLAIQKEGKIVRQKFVKN